MIEEKQTSIKKDWNFDNSYARLPELFYSVTNPTPVCSPKLVILNQPLALTLGLDLNELQSADGIAVLAGNKLPEGALPLAQAYAGHQFGYFTMLGDGRAVLLGEQITPQAERFDIQLKGSGKTPYSRRGDGRAALGPMLREYIISEAMHALGIPTTRSLAVVTTGESVIRETELPGAVLTRVAASHLRVGTFQYAATWGTVGELRILADYTLKRHFPEAKTVMNPYHYLLQEVIKRQAVLIAKWQLVGFIHGVMNTDNMTISGETIDYGPCAFMDAYNPATVFSSIDLHGRYAYGNQPRIAEWNLARFAETLLPLLHQEQQEAVKIAQEALAEFFKLFNDYWTSGMRAKLGLFNQETDDQLLIADLLKMMYNYQADFTNTFRALTVGELQGMTLFETDEFKSWQRRWQERRSRQQESTTQSQELMKRTNPAIIPRNHRIEEALKAAGDGDYSIMERLLAVLSCPYAYSDEQLEYTQIPPPSAYPYRTFCGT
ncbi:MAG TPA: YdiU family protein [Bacillota bacterium]|nr:YdiU family protein [Bacillota bacterium]HOL09181.1 YdiU family protein [Bacillota bacterium]HPO96856.1 YdiU family protein [Bacillota bacterium]